jgi:hypothetical protein
VKVPGRDDDASAKLDASRRADQRDAANRSVERATRGHWRFDAQDSRVGRRDLDLRLAPRGADDAHRLELSLGTVNRDGFPGRELTRLGQRSRHRQGRGAEERSRIGVRQVDMSVRHADAHVDRGRTGWPLSR